jgi:hypothetical protein
MEEKREILIHADEPGDGTRGINAINIGSPDGTCQPGTLSWGGRKLMTRERSDELDQRNESEELRIGLGHYIRSLGAIIFANYQ